jgi:hypothetical protein
MADTQGTTLLEAILASTGVLPILGLWQNKPNFFASL